MLATFHHLEQPTRSIKEAYRVLKPGGYLVIFDYTEKGIEKLKKKYPDHPDYVDPREFLDKDKKEWEEVLFEDDGDLFGLVLRKI